MQIMLKSKKLPDKIRTVYIEFTLNIWYNVRYNTAVYTYYRVM